MTTALARATELGGPLPARVRVAIVGTGFAGIATAIGLMRSGRHDFVLLERAEALGGTWRDNSYPGCACDVPSHLYSFSFAPNPDWTRAFSPQPEIEAYLHRTAEEYGVLPHIRYGAELEGAVWDEAEQIWHLTTARGELDAELLVLGTGGLSDPAIPAIPGLDAFAGTTFHSATWDHDHDLRGQRVAVIGTGASAIQFVPAIQPQVGHLTLFQRTAPWVLPRRDRAIRSNERRLYRRFPALQRAARTAIYWGREAWVLGFSFDQRIMELGEKQAHAFLAKQVPDPELRAKLTPHFRLGCKRVLLSNTYFPALTQPNVDVVTEHIREIRPHAVVTADGVEHPADTIIFGTGFRVTDPPIAERIVGRSGITLTEHWASGGMRALHGAMTSGFPNLVYLVGPNTGLGHSSIVFIIETQVGYLLDALRQLDARGLATLEPKPEVEAAYNSEVQKRLQKTVWSTGGCASWYLDKNGRNTTLWPTFTFTFRRKLRRCDLGNYVTTARRSRTPKVAA
ncbi:MAG: NAD(P)/FAD-dependent oxidoreductase [Frankiaceae bacterium]|nr:NAD(P)/FAD-dependent oxidoreductase [Frankiaceae bacterium]